MYRLILWPALTIAWHVHIFAGDEAHDTKSMLSSDAIYQDAHSHHHDPNKWDDDRVDGHAPIGVMGEHTHNKGEWMLAYRYMTMGMDDNFIGSDSVADESFLTSVPLEARNDDSFLVAPTFMAMEMHMFGLMYAPTDEFTAMVMIPYIKKSMDHVRLVDGFRFTTKSEDVGDIKVGGLYKIYDDKRQRIHLNFQVSIPTGSITEADGTPQLPLPPEGPSGLTTLTESRLPYPMQTGSGTFDIEPGFTYLGQSDHFSWGLQAKGVIRTHENDEGYTLGNEFKGTIWGAIKITDWLSSSVRFSGHAWEDLDGADEVLSTAQGEIGPMIFLTEAVPTARTDLRGGAETDIAFGLNFKIPKGVFSGNRFAVEAGFPVWRDLNGPQLGEEFTVTAGWQYAW